MSESGQQISAANALSNVASYPTDSDTLPLYSAFITPVDTTNVDAVFDTELSEKDDFLVLHLQQESLNDLKKEM